MGKRENGVEMFSKEWELVVTVTTVCDRKRNGAGSNQWLSMNDRCGLKVLVLRCARISQLGSF